MTKEIRKWEDSCVSGAKRANILRSYSTEMLSYKIDGAFAYAVTAAADAIEQLGKDNAVLTKERDAAVRDLKTYGNVCFICRYHDSCYSKFSGFNPKCGAMDNTHWEWRGVQET